MKTAIISVTSQGDGIAKEISCKVQCDIYFREDVKNLGLKSITKKVMNEFQNIIFIASTGIAVRAIAPYIDSKDKDSAVIVIDSTGKFVISLLSGHLGGANELTTHIANIINAQPIITTATDNLGITAPDIIAKENNLLIEDLKKAKEISARLVDGEKVLFLDERKIIAIPKGYVSIEKVDGNKEDNLDKYKCLSEDNSLNISNKVLDYISGIVYVTDKINCFNGTKVYSLRLIRKDIVIGIGCRKNFDRDKMLGTVLEYLEKNNIDYRAVKTIATVSVKEKEKAIIDLVKELNADIKIFSIEEIKKVQHKYDGSSFVEKTIGVTCVCEPCAELSGAELLLKKVKCDGMTLAIGRLK